MSMGCLRHPRESTKCREPISSGTTVTGMECRASIIIPAHNEERRIRGLLEVLSEAARTESYAIFVICNGCTDRTREIAEAFEDVRVVEIADVGKHFALNEGDRLAGDIFPRLYCDADVGIDVHSLSRLIDVLTADQAIAAGPTVHYDVAGRSWGVKKYYQSLETPIMAKWLDLHLMGRGLYGASREARQRFDVFPSLYADDDFFDSRFSETEKVVVRDAIVTIWTPGTVRELLRIETRVAMGNRQFARFVSEEQHVNRVDTAATNLGQGVLSRKLRTLRQWRKDIRLGDFVPLAVYLSVAGSTRVRLALLKIRQRTVSWR